VDFRAVYPEADPKAVDLLDRMLVFDPEERIGVAEALAHPYLASLHDEDDEPTCATPFAFEFENEALSEERVRTLVFEELRGFHAELRRKEREAREGGEGKGGSEEGGPPGGSDV
jgi:serine/threonine protein kinase